MNKDVFESKWNQLKDEAQNLWNKLTDDDIDQISGSYDLLVVKLQETYGYEKERAERGARLFYDTHV